MSEEKLRNRFHQALDRSLDGLTEDAMLCQRVLRMAGRKERKPVKKKISVGFAVAMVMVLGVTTAFAIAISRQYFQKVGEIQATSGAYDEWSTDNKLAILDLMEEYQVLSETEMAQASEIRQLPVDQQEAALNRLMAEKYGIHGRTDVIGLESILTAEMGDKAFWSVEDKAWYIELLSSLGLLSADEEQMYVRPGENDMTQVEAEALARLYLKDNAIWGMKAEALPAVNFSLVKNADGVVTWEVTFYDEATDTDIFLRLPAARGTVAAQVRMENQRLWEKGTAPWNKARMTEAQTQVNRYDALVKQFGDPSLNTWPLEAWNVYLPVQYLLPEATDIAPEQAEAIALAALMEQYPSEAGQMGDCVKQLRLTAIGGVRMYILTYGDAKGNEIFGCRVNAATGDVILTAYHE